MTSLGGVSTTTLGEFLRARRAQLRPADVGLPAGARRRVAGLRREEVAVLAGISPEYYLRLEQGRDLNPSSQVLQALAEALHLDGDATSYLSTVARPGLGLAARRGSRGRPERVSAHVQDLIDSWPTTAAYVLGRGSTVLAANAPARALSPHFAAGATPLRALFLDSHLRDLYRDWDAVTVKAVAHLRSTTAGTRDDPRVVTLIGELSLHSDRFRELWARADVKVRDDGPTRLTHPQVGPLDLQYTKLTLVEHEQLLVTYHAERGGVSAGAWRVLCDLAQQVTGDETQP